MLPEIEMAEQKVLEAEKELKRTISDAHSKCSHPIEACREGKFQKMTYVRSFPPFRVCTLCGYAEEGWGCGFWKLNFNYKEVPEMSRDAAMKYVKKFWRQEDLDKVRFDPKRRARLIEARNEYYRATGREVPNDD